MRQYFKLTPNEKIAKNCLHHRGEIVLLDEVISCHLNGILTQSTIRKNNAFLSSFMGGGGSFSSLSKY